jgi:hypothetical protein
MVVAVALVRMMEAVSDQVVDVVAMRNGLVTALLAVDVVGLVAPAALLGRAALRSLGVDLQHVLVDVVFGGMVEVSVVQIIDVIGVRNGGVAAARSMLVGVIRVSGMCVHVTSFQ